MNGIIKRVLWRIRLTKAYVRVWYDYRKIRNYKIQSCDEIGGEGLDCKKEDCKHHSVLGCHGCDDPQNQSACKLPLVRFLECINNNYKHYVPWSLTDGTQIRRNK